MSSNTSPVTVLILYYSRHGSTRALAEAISEGVTAAGADVLLRSVAVESDAGDSAASARELAVDLDDLERCDALALGSPTRFGQMTSHLHRFFEGTSKAWLQGVLTDKPAAVFTSSSSLHGGQESTLLSMALPLLHHGMLLLGIPYSEPAVHNTETGGGPYGASHVSHNQNTQLSAHERQCAKALGQRLADTARKLKSS